MTPNKHPSSGREGGAAVVEMALVLPLLLVVALALAPLVQRMLVADALHEAANQGVRYATKYRTSPLTDPPGCVDAARRPTEDDVRQATLAVAPAGVAAGDIDVLVDGVDATDLCGAAAGAIVTVAIDHVAGESSTEAAADDVAALLGGTIFGDTYQVHVDAAGVLE